jgi:ERCC4-type nuclease
MAYKLTKNPKIMEDYNKFKDAVQDIQNSRIKKQYEVLLKDFLNQIKIIEEGHSVYNNGFIDPKNNRENIIRLVELRRKLTKLIKE